MSSVWRSLLLMAAGAPVSAAAGQQVRELGAQALATASDPVLVGGGVWAGLRPSLRLRIGATLAAGLAGGRAAGRGELVAHFLVNPTAATGLTPYLGGGVAGVVDSAERGYLVALVGIEGRPGARAGWAVELGVGGGARLALAYRWRRLPAHGLRAR